MAVLVSGASRHGATKEIAQEIGAVLQGHGLEVDLRAPEDVTSLQGYTAAVLGSAVYLGRWLAPMRHLVYRSADTLATLPVWLFSSGPRGDPARRQVLPFDAAAEMREATHARDHRVFAGSLQRATLPAWERAVVAVLRLPDGDARDWSAIRVWAASIATALTAPSAQEGHSRS